MGDSSGPYLTMAVLCERVLQEQDGVLSAIRIIDRITQSAEGPGAPDEMPPFPIQLTALLSFKSGEARGRRKVTLRPEDPSGHQLKGAEMPLLFEGEDRGMNVILQIGLVAEYEGLYWIDVLLDQERVTRMPLRVIYAPTRAGG